MTKKSLNLLKQLCAAHSTPGDEGDVAAILKRQWKKAGWEATGHGGYALSAARRSAKRRHLLICAHMDSPGFIVDCPGWITKARSKTARLHIVPLGSPAFSGSRTAARLKCRNGIFPGFIRKANRQEETEFCFEMPRAVAKEADLCIGDRICYDGELRVEDNLIKSPFLDNRLGCWMLTRLTDLKPGWNKRCDITLAAAGSEEMNGFGAQVLAARVKADLVIVLDATYEAKEQGVLLGGGSVVTLSDNSVLITPEQRDRIRKIMTKARVPIQFEAYNYSGTDARAFPMQGKVTPVIALLLPTRGNHSPCETADIDDLKHWEKAIKALERGVASLRKL